MNKLLLSVCLFFVGSFLEAKPLFEEYKTKILEASDKSAIIADSPAFVVGSSGIVMHKFDDKTATIIARVDVISKNGDKATIRFEQFEMLSQVAFPDTGVKPIVGDEVTINYLYDRALIITPNQSVYNEVTKKYNNITWVHPDIVAGYLTKLYRPNPDKTIFQKACYQNAASLIFFAIKDNGYFVDCHNFNTIQSIKVSDNGEIQLPFYSRIKDIDTSWFSWSSAKIPDYNSYYTTFISK